METKRRMDLAAIHCRYGNVATATAAAPISCSLSCSLTNTLATSELVHVLLLDAGYEQRVFARRASIKVITSQGHGKMPTPPFLIFIKYVLMRIFAFY